MSGVRNLRAMFEQRGENNPPDRGRSPGPGGIVSPSPSASPRPLSKVRTSFVAVEKDGRIGLKREPSGDSTNTTTPQPLSERTDVFTDNMAKNASSFKMNLSHEAIPESPRQDTPVKLSPKKDVKTSHEEEPHAKMLPSNPAESSAARLGGTVLNEGIATKTKASSTTKPAAKTTAPISTAKTTTRAPKSPMMAKASGAKEPTKSSSLAATSSINPKKTTATKTAALKPTPIDLPSSGTGFVKPKPKSPTRPVKLPSSLLTHTAASAQKLGTSNATPAPRQSLSRASGNAQHLSVNSTAHRSPTAKTLRHKASNVGRSRKDQSNTKKDSQVDEGFLARMMRPTQSSSSKTSDKAPVTPPRKENMEKNAKRVAAKIQASSTKAKTAKDTVKSVVKEQPTAKEIAPAVSQAETAEAAIEEAKLSSDTAEAPVVEEQKMETEASAEAIAAVVAQEETAEDIVETAKISVDTAITPLVEKSEAEAAVVEPTTTASVEEDRVEPKEEEVQEPAASIPVVCEDPQKVEDIEDTVQETQGTAHQPEPIEVVAEVTQSQEVPKISEPTTESTEEPAAEARETTANETVADGSTADTDETAVEEVNAEAPKTIDAPLDGAVDTHTTEESPKDVVTAPF
ncbi:hypothetical protein F5Y19DRAFT_464457 [Xylariaceae sp. FL1651]|nr:hypothetical protein F5Y19DRAFT_464457 [Xylariaceae sp. FL1651]